MKVTLSISNVIATTKSLNISIKTSVIELVPSFFFGDMTADKFDSNDGKRNSPVSSAEKI